MNKLIIIGYWEGADDDILYPHPIDLIDINWNKEEIYKVAEYLREGLTIWHEMGYSYCRFSDGITDEETGCSEKTDGVWIWPEGLHIYVERYSVKLPEEFLRHIYNNNFKIPDNLDLNELRKYSADDTFWLKWARKKIPQKYPWWHKYLPRSCQLWYFLIYKYISFIKDKS